MMPRKPYRSPFWKPGSKNEQPRGAGASRVAVESEGSAGPAPARTSSYLGSPGQDHSEKYSSRDIEQFSRLMKFDGRSDPALGNDGPIRHSVREEIRARSGPGVAAPQASPGNYKTRDMDLFQSIQQEFSKTRNKPAARPGTPAQPAPTDHARTYSQQDIEAFEKLMKFGSR